MASGCVEYPLNVFHAFAQAARGKKHGWTAQKTGSGSFSRAPAFDPKQSFAHERKSRKMLHAETRAARKAFLPDFVLVETAGQKVVRIWEKRYAPATCTDYTFGGRHAGIARRISSPPDAFNN